MKQMPLHVITIMLEAEKVFCFLFHLWNEIISRLKFAVEKYKEIIYTFKINTVYSFFYFWNEILFISFYDAGKFVSKKCAVLILSVYSMSLLFYSCF